MNQLIFDLLGAEVEEAEIASLTFDHTPLRDKLDELILLDDDDAAFWKQVQNTFKFIEIAEQEIERAQRRHPEQASQLHRTFSFIRPDHFINYHPTIYRHHCRELLERIATGADTRPGTLAEAAIAIMQVTLATPVQRDVAILYGRLFKCFFPEQYETLRYFPTEESYPGRCDEILATLLRKLTAPRRRWENDAARIAEVT